MATPAAAPALAAELEWPGLLDADRQLIAELLEGVRTGAVRAPQAWRQLAQDVLRPEQPFGLHMALHAAVFAGWDERVLGPAPVWVPGAEDVAGTNLIGFMERFTDDMAWASQRSGHPATDFRLLQRVSCDNPEAFWAALLRELGVKFAAPPTRMLQEAAPSDPDGCVWLPGARLNIAEAALSCPRAPPDAPAVLWAPEGRPRDVRAVSRAELRQRCHHVASCISARFRPGSAIAINMPMTVEAVVAYLGIVLAGCSVVSIADSFAAAEIAARLCISKAQAIFTQDVVLRGGKALPLYARVADAAGPPAIVLPADGPAAAPRLQLRPGDASWAEFLAGPGGGAGAVAAFAPRMADAQETTNILFSSGTTGEPKAIPWSHVTPLRCAADGWAHQDVRPGSVVAWPTNLGWMMGPWLVYASLLNGGTMALYQGAPLGRDFGEFVEAAGVEVLGLVPSIVKAWRASGCMANVDWRRLRAFSSTGEASAPEDYHWLASRVLGYRPVLEYCGGTEIGGAFLTATLLQPQAASAFSTPSLGARLVLLGPEGEQSAHFGGGPFIGELALVPPMLGLSQRLLNRDHAKTYYEGMPADAATRRVLRRHGDEVARLAGGYYRALGRCDDTMNLGGIKARRGHVTDPSIPAPPQVSSVEIERVVMERAPDLILDAAAVGMPAPGGGPEQLVIFVVPREAGRDAALLAACQAAVRAHLNPLFKVERVVAVASLPRTASNKVMRRVLRDQLAAPPRARL
ncbi:MAG: hypothetical protein J3K34DRAFT_388561 [Monoraphidium minutum]|nr:MAG: hypothetical protein J3K34DRAFT_388561 [Monoraphidium minutum]